MSGISKEPYFRNSLSEHSFEGVPSSYNLTKSVSDPLKTVCLRYRIQKLEDVFVQMCVTLNIVMVNGINQA